MVFEKGTGVGQIAADSNVKVNVAEGTIQLKGVENPVTVEICSISGMLEDRIEAEGDMIIDLNRYGVGVHVVTVGSSTFKILTR